jgi:hypothetical protein
MVMRWSANAMDKYIAPELSAFTSASIPDMAQFDAEQEHWLGNHLLNSVLRGGSSPAGWCTTVIRRCEGVQALIAPRISGLVSLSV